MKVKRTFGATMREALAQVKLEQGPDAVILGNKKVPGGVEILSTLDFDQHQFDASEPVSQRMPRPSVQPIPQPTSRPAAATRQQLADEESVPDFILKQSEQGRQEPVLGIARNGEDQRRHAPASQVRRPAPAAQGKRPVEPSQRESGYQRETATRRPQTTREQPVQQPRSRMVDDSGFEPETQADQLLNSLRDNGYQGQAARGDDKPLIEEVKDELKNLRELMKTQLNVLEWDRYNQRHPVRSVLLNLMAELGLGSDVTETVFEHLGQLTDDPQKVWQKALGILATAIPITTTDILSTGGRIALVGSTGVGKTTTIAKLAARFAHIHGKQSVALVTTDNFRIGAHEQLQHFARMLEIPLLTANSSEELTDRLKMLSDKRLVLIDTAGMSQNDVRLSESFHKLQHGSPEIRPYLVLSANTQLAALSETINNFSKVKLSGAIVTKIDESASLGGIITAAIRHQLPLTYCGTGQRVPEDLHQAKNHRLVSKAVSLMQKYSEDFDKETLAFRYNHLITQQQG